MRTNHDDPLKSVIRGDEFDFVKCEDIMKAIKYCPACGSEFRNHPLKDIYLVGMSCKNGHYFYADCKDVSGRASTRPSISSPEYNGHNEREIIEFWLTDIDARAALNPQLAVMIRRIHEILFENRHIPQEHEIFKYCPICRSELMNYDQDDCWVQGKKCSNSHEYAERGGAINGVHAGERIGLSAEMSDESLRWLIDGWLKDRKVLKAQLNKELAQILHKYTDIMKGT